MLKGLAVGFMVMSFLYFDTEVHRRTGPYMGGVGWCGGWWGGWGGRIFLIYTYVLVSQFEDELIGFPNIPTSLFSPGLVRVFDRCAIY